MPYDYFSILFCQLQLNYYFVMLNVSFKLGFHRGKEREVREKGEKMNP